MYANQSNQAIGAISGASLGMAAQTAAVGYAGSPLRDRGQLEVAADHVANEIGALSNMFDALEQRLSSVLQPEAPQPAPAPAPAPAPGIPVSPAVDYLGSQRLRVEGLQRRVQSLLARLDT